VQVRVLLLYQFYRTKNNMKWKLQRIDWHSKGLCWTWLKIKKHVFYSGNQIQWSWGRISFVFERKVWNEPS